MKELQTELEYYVECIKELRRIRREVGLAAADAFKQEMREYFRIPRDMDSVFIDDTLLRLASTPAGTSTGRMDEHLKAIHAMEKGDAFWLHGRKCIFLYHTGRRDHPREGFFEFTYADNRAAYRTMDYNDAWSLLTDGDMVIDVVRT